MRQELLKLAWVNPVFMAEPSNRADRRRTQRDGHVASSGGDRPQYKTIIISAVVGAILAQFIPSVFDLFRGDIKNKIVTQINQTLAPITRDIGDLKTQVAVLKNSVETLEKLGTVGRLKAQATKLGVKDPQIVSVDLKPQALHRSLYST